MKYSSKIVTNHKELLKKRRAAKKCREIVVFTNGCFDLLHPGHTRYLKDAKALGDHLIVAINSDKSVRTIKGAGRPIQSEQARAEVLAALEAVDWVTLFDEETPYNLIKLLEPDILVKGGDWAIEKIVGADLVEGSGGKVTAIPVTYEGSTSDIIEKILHSSL